MKSYDWKMDHQSDSESYSLKPEQNRCVFPINLELEN